MRGSSRQKGLGGVEDAAHGFGLGVDDCATAVVRDSLFSWRPGAFKSGFVSLAAPWQARLVAYGSRPGIPFFPETPDRSRGRPVVPVAKGGPGRRSRPGGVVSPAGPGVAPDGRFLVAAALRVEDR